MLLLLMFLRSAPKPRLLALLRQSRMAFIFCFRVMFFKSTDMNSCVTILMFTPPINSDAGAFFVGVDAIPQRNIP